MIKPFMIFTCVRKIFEIARRMNKRQLKADFKFEKPKPIEMNFVNISEWVGMKFESSNHQDPAGAEDWIVLP